MDQMSSELFNVVHQKLELFMSYQNKGFICSLHITETLFILFIAFKEML